MEPETYNVETMDIDDVNDLICQIFDYLLELDGKAITDDEIREKKKVEKIWIDTPEMIKIETVDDSKKDTYNKLYFNGECDTSQTRYEFLSNQCRICTVAKTDKVGKALHTFLRQVIDDHSEDFFLYVFGMETKKEFTVKEMVDLLEKWNDHYSNICDPREGLYYDRKLSAYRKEITIHRFIPDVDTWNIYRIAEALGIWGPEEQYKDINL